MIEQLIEYAKEIENLLKEGKNLREIAQYSFEERSKKRNVPYFAIVDTERVGRGTVAVRLSASPTVAQKELKAFLGQKAPGFISFPKYIFDVLEDKVDFRECTGIDENGNKIFKNLLN